MSWPVNADQIAAALRVEEFVPLRHDSLVVPRWMQIASRVSRIFPDHRSLIETVCRVKYAEDTTAEADSRVL